MLMNLLLLKYSLLLVKRGTIRSVFPFRLLRIYYLIILILDIITLGLPSRKDHHPLLNSRILRCLTLKCMAKVLMEVFKCLRKRSISRLSRSGNIGS